MEQFIANNLVGIIGIITAIIIAIFTIIKTKKRKELSYTILSSTSLLLKEEGLKKRIKIFVDDGEVEGEVNLVLLKLVNTGNTPITPEDFVENISLETSGSIIIAEVKETTPKNITVEIDNEIGEIFGITEIKPTLLNAKDEVTLKLLIQSYKNDLLIKGRIIGVQGITKLKEKFPFATLFFTITFIVILILFRHFIEDSEIVSKLDTILTMMIVVTTMLSFINALTVIKKLKQIKIKEKG